MSDEPIAVAPAAKILRWGDWSDEPTPLDDVPPDVLAAAVRWMQTGDPAEIGDQRAAALVHRQHMAMIQDLHAAQSVIDRLRAEFATVQRRTQATLSSPIHADQGYQRGYDMGAVVHLDAALTGLQEVRDTLTRHARQGAPDA